MSVKRNVVANYVGQLYSALAGVVLVPMYIKYMGVEAFGLVGFYATLQGWLMLLDMGLTPTIAREAARFGGGATSAIDLRRLLRAFEGVFALLAGVGAAALIASSGVIAVAWLKLQQLDVWEVRRALMLMALVVAIRLVCGLYRSVLGGFERLVWVNGFSVVITTLRFVLVIPYLAFVGATPTHFFSFQLGVAALELLVLASKAYAAMPIVDVRGWIPWRWSSLQGVLPYAMSTAVASTVWVVITQTDKLVISGLVPLTDFAYFTLALLVASGISLLSMPISGAILPRMIKLHAQRDEAGLIRLYREATQWVAVVATPLVLLFAFFAAPVLTAWTGNAALAAQAAPILTLYAIGNGALAMAAFPYYLQVARGDLQLHLVGNLLFMTVFLPLLVLSVMRFGVMGAGYAWIAANLLPFLTWLPLVHRRHLKGLHFNWLIQDILIIAVAPGLAAGLLAWLIEWPTSQPRLLFVLCCVFALLSLLAAVGSSTVKARFLGAIRVRPV